MAGCLGKANSSSGGGAGWGQAVDGPPARRIDNARVFTRGSLIVATALGSGLLHHDGGAGSRNHQHAVILAQHLVIQIDADHGICAQ